MEYDIKFKGCDSDNNEENLSLSVSQKGCLTIEDKELIDEGSCQTLNISGCVGSLIKNEANCYVNYGCAKEFIDDYSKYDLGLSFSGLTDGNPRVCLSDESVTSLSDAIYNYWDYENKVSMYSCLASNVPMNLYCCNSDCTTCCLCDMLKDDSYEFVNIANCNVCCYTDIRAFAHLYYSAINKIINSYGSSANCAIVNFHNSMRTYCSNCALLSENSRNPGGISYIGEYIYKYLLSHCGVVYKMYSGDVIKGVADYLTQLIYSCCNISCDAVLCSLKTFINKCACYDTCLMQRTNTRYYNNYKTFNCETKIGTKFTGLGANFFHSVRKINYGVGSNLVTGYVGGFYTECYGRNSVYGRNENYYYTCTKFTTPYKKLLKADNNTYYGQASSGSSGYYAYYADWVFTSSDSLSTFRTVNSIEEWNDASSTYGCVYIDSSSPSQLEFCICNCYGGNDSSGTYRTITAGQQLSYYNQLGMSNRGCLRLNVSKCDWIGVEFDEYDWNNGCAAALFSSSNLEDGVNFSPVSQYIPSNVVVNQQLYTPQRDTLLINVNSSEYGSSSKYISQACGYSRFKKYYCSYYCNTINNKNEPTIQSFANSVSGQKQMYLWNPNRLTMGYTSKRVVDKNLYRYYLPMQVLYATCSSGVLTLCLNNEAFNAQSSGDILWTYNSVSNKICIYQICNINLRYNTDYLQISVLEAGGCYQVTDSDTGTTTTCPPYIDYSFITRIVPNINVCTCKPYFA